MSEHDALVERVAEEIHNARCRRDPRRTFLPWDEWSRRGGYEPLASGVRDDARAAVAAVREHDGFRLTWERGKFVPVGDDEAIATLTQTVRDLGEVVADGNGAVVQGAGLEALIRDGNAKSVEIVPLTDGRFAVVVWREDDASSEDGTRIRSGCGANGLTIEAALRAALDDAALGEGDDADNR